MDTSKVMLEMEKETRCQTKLQRLLLISQKEQWNIDDLDWEGLSFEEMPIYFQQHLATVFSHLRYGEQMALQCIQRLRNEITDPIQIKLLDIQIQDEKRHVVFFQRILQSLHQPHPLRESFQKLMTDIYNAPTTEMLLVGMHIMIENIAHSLFQSAQDVITHATVSPSNTSLISLQEITNCWIPNYVMIDESRHLAIGHIMLLSYIPRLTLEQKVQLEGTITRWGTILLEMVDDPDMLQSIGLQQSKHAIQCLKDVNLRLRQIDIDVQIPLPESI